MRAAALFLVALLLTTTAGCAHYAERNALPPLAIDLPQGPPDQVFTRLVSITRALGYPIDFADVRYGVFGTHTRTSLAGREGAATLVVQCFADGRASVTVLGGTPIDDLWTRVPDRMRREIVLFAQRLENGGPDR